jgi:hypothetical protein
MNNFLSGLDILKMLQKERKMTGSNVNKLFVNN